MIIKNLKLNNIRSYTEEEIKFPKGSLLLSGDIGCGKTSILLGIEFALFGLQPGQRGNSLLRNGQTNGGVIMEFQVDNKEIIIERTLKKAKTISQDYCAITINDLKKEISVTELKSLVLEILNYPKEFSKKQNLLYKFTVYTPQEEMKQIILQDPETRINTLRHVFGIDKYKKMLENLAIINSKIREQKRINEALTSNLERDKSEVISKEQILGDRKINLISFEKNLFLKKEIKNNIEEEKSEITKKVNEKTKLQQEIEKTKLVISNKQETILNNEKISNQLKIQIEEFRKMIFDESQIILIEEKIEKLKMEEDKMNHAKLNILSQINSINFKDQENEKLEKKFSNLEVCPTCLQGVDAIYRANILNKAHSEASSNKKKLKILEEEITQITNKIIEIKSNISIEEKALTDIKILKMQLHEINDKEKRLKDIDDANLILNKDIEFLKKHNEDLIQSVFEFGKYDGIFETKSVELVNSIREERIAEIQLAELKKEIQMSSDQIQELKIKIEKLEQIKNKLNHLIELEDWLNRKFIPMVSVVERNVMIRLKSEFSKLFEEWFGMLVSDSLNVRLDDKFTPIIEQYGYEIDYAYLSGGERTAVALAYRLALNQIINSIIGKIKTKDLVILDEPTDGFSEQQLDKMREVLEQLNMEQLIIVSHEQKIEGFVENVYKVKKLNGISIV